MNANWRFPMILGLSVVLGWPALQDMAMLTTADLGTAALRYLGALVVAWIGVGTVFKVAERYRRENEVAQRLAALQAAREAAAAAAADAAQAEADDRASRADQAARLVEAEAERVEGTRPMQSV